MAANAALSPVKTVADPNASYESLRTLWKRSRAVCSGERYVKEIDASVDKTNFTNLLIPFSPSMTPAQYNFYKAEAELPGIVNNFAKMLVGGLLRKPPTITLPEDIPEGTLDWILNEFGQDDSPLSAFLDKALWEELQTSRAWVFVDYPQVNNPEALSEEEVEIIKPYPILHQAESIINWKISQDAFGKSKLQMVIVRGYEEVYTEKNEWHPEFKETVYVHELDDSGAYQIRVFQNQAPSNNVPYVAGKQIKDVNSQKPKFDLIRVVPVFVNNERLNFIPAWPLNGNIEPAEPMLSTIIDKEVHLYNKLSRRNHLLYGAATYTPYITADISDEDFDAIVNAGLGSWFKIPAGSTAGVLGTPTDALADMDKAIASSIEEMAKLGIRMLTPETAQSGVALEIRNAAQTAQLGTLNLKVSNIMRQIIVFMINWRYDLELTIKDVQFSLSSDFNPVPLGSDWLKLATEWYQMGLIPRTVWLEMLKQNDLIPPDYNDEEALKEINADSTIQPKGTDEEANKLEEV